MIRINLLGRERPKVYRPIQITGPWVGVLFLLPVVVAAMAIYVSYKKVATRNEELNAEIVFMKNQVAEMDKIKQDMAEVEAQEAKVRARIAVIERLQRNQAGPATLLADLGSRVSMTETVWLSEITERTGGQYELRGNAGSVEAIANLITNLSKSEYFKDVEFKESTQVKSGQEFEGTFEFTLTAVFAIPAPEEEKTPPAPGTNPAAPAAATGGR